MSIGSGMRQSALKGSSAPPTRVRQARPAAAYASAAVAEVTAALGSNEAALALGVSRSQPSRWLSGAEGLSPESAARVSDLANVITQLRLVWAGELIDDWLRSANAHLGGRVPIEVFKRHGAAPLLAAIRAEAAGAYA